MKKMTEKRPTTIHKAERVKRANENEHECFSLKVNSEMQTFITLILEHYLLYLVYNIY